MSAPWLTRTAPWKCGRAWHFITEDFGDHRAKRRWDLSPSGQFKLCARLRGHRGDHRPTQETDPE